MPKKPVTEMTLPEHARPEEFLRDADLVGFYQRAFDAMDADDPSRTEAEAYLKQLKRSAAMTAAEVES